MLDIVRRRNGGRDLLASPLGRLHDEMDTLFNRFFGSDWAVEPLRTGYWLPALDIAERELRVLAEQNTQLRKDNGQALSLLQKHNIPLEGAARKPIAAICHGAQLLAAAGVVEGKRCSAYPAVGPDVTRAGGTYADLAIDGACVDGNLVTAPAWPAHPAWLAKFLEVLGTKIQP